KTPGDCVFFTQHITEIVRMEPVHGQFFVARGNPLVKVSVRRRGGTRSRFVWCFRGVEGPDEFWGLKGAFRGCNPPGHRRNPPTGKQLEVRDEDGEKPPPRLRGRFGRGFGWAGSRSSGQGQASRIREGLQPLWRRLLLYAWHRHLLEDRWLCAGGNDLS